MDKKDQAGMLQMARLDAQHGLENLRKMTQFLSEKIPYGKSPEGDNSFLLQEIEKTRRMLGDESVYLDNLTRPRRIGLPEIPLQEDPEQILLSEKDIPDGTILSARETVLNIIAALRARGVLFGDGPTVTSSFDGSLVVSVEPFISFDVRPAIGLSWPFIDVRFRWSGGKNPFNAENFYLAHSLIEAMVSEYERLRGTEISATAP